jgi:phage gp45-like
MNTMDAIGRALQQAKTFAKLLIRRGELSTSPQSFFCQMAGFADETLDDVELWAHFGIASRPPSGTQALTVHLNGLSEEAICVASESQADRPTDLDEGEAVLYGKIASTGGQAQVRAKPDGSVAVVAGTLAGISVTAGTLQTVTVGPLAEIAGNTDAMLKGTTFAAALNTYIVAMVAAGTVWAGGGKVLPDLAIYVEAAVAAMTVLNGTWAAGVPMLSLKAKVG